MRIKQHKYKIHSIARNYLGVFVAGAFVLLGACALVLYHTENISAKTTEILFLFLSSLGTVMLAGATWLSLQETRKERKVPIKREELNNIIQPSINTAESNKKRLNEDYDRRMRENGGADLTEVPPPGFTNNHSAINRQFFEKHPGLAKQVERHNELLREIESQVDTLADTIRPMVQTKQDELGYDVDADYFVRFLINDRSAKNIGSSFRGYEHWKEHESSYREVMEREEVRQEKKRLQRTEEKLLKLIEETLLPALKNEQARIQYQYGVVVEDGSYF